MVSISDEQDLGPEADPESVGRKILLDQLTGRARSRSDLAKKLAQKNVPDDIATRLLDRFEEVGLVDDAAFANEWVMQRQESRGLAKRALAQELRKKGIDDEVARAALDSVDADDEIEKRILEKLGIGPTVDRPAKAAEKVIDPDGIDF